MVLSYLLLIPVTGAFFILSKKDSMITLKNIKVIGLSISILNLFLSLIIFILFDFSTIQFQFVQEFHEIGNFDLFLGIDGLSIYFILLTAIIMPISILSNWTSISEDVESYVIIILLLETLLLAVFLVLDILLFYIFFESILPPLFILVGIFGSDNRVKASFYLFLYTLNQKCKRTKHRGSPKALVTKVIWEIFLLAWLMTQGMVTSLVFIFEKLLLVTDTWVIAVLSHPWFKACCKKARDSKGVKEQRVDSSSNTRILEFVRCTLVAGKPVFGRKIHHLYNSKIVSSMVKRSIHTKVTNGAEGSQFTLDPWFITGLIEAEGCFTLGFFKSDDYRMGYRIQAIFKISLHRKDYDILCQIKDFFGVGSITKHGENSLQYTVRSLKDLNIIISHFDKYPLLSQKLNDFILFKDAITLIRNKEHLNRNGFLKILSIKASIHSGLSDELKLSFPDIKPIYRPLLLNKRILNPNWIAGLASGDGCFHVSIRDSPTTKLGKAVVLKFHIAQHSRDSELMEMLIQTMRCGKIEWILKQSAVYFVVVKFKDIFEKIIPLFDNYPLKGVKALDFHDFKNIANLMHNKEHLTKEGISKIKSIKLKMNSLRKL